MENPAPPYPVQSVDHVLQLLLMLKRDGVLRVSDAAAELGVAKSTAHRLISMLRFRGFVEQASDRTYRVGSALADLGGGGIGSTTALLGIARPHLTRLTEQSGESSNLMIRVGADVQFIDTVETSQALRIGSRVGHRLAARLCSGGKVLLADLPFEEVALLHPGLADDPAALSALRRQLSATQRQGFGTAFSEGERGVVALGMAVRGVTGAAIAAAAVALPTVRFNRGKFADLVPLLTETVEGIRSDIIGLTAPKRRGRPGS
ncbi:MAG TPA: IclR family transcriptional regulator [Trebonia sp.]|jgi:DNA-binding IclR family transcriptional regulator|nr:IclR family transcriptional regulator [Trebonia sp.]